MFLRHSVDHGGRWEIRQWRSRALAICLVHPAGTDIYGTTAHHSIMLTLGAPCQMHFAGLFGRSRSSKVIDFGANRKRVTVCDLLLVGNSNVGPILHHFGDFAGFLCS